MTPATNQPAGKYTNPAPTLVNIIKQSMNRLANVALFSLALNLNQSILALVFMSTRNRFMRVLIFLLGLGI